MAMQHTNDYITMCLSSPAYTVTKALTILNRFGKKKNPKNLHDSTNYDIQHKMSTKKKCEKHGSWEPTVA